MPHPLTASTPSNVAAVVQMAGTGLSQEKIAKALGISKKTVWTILAHPDVATKVAALRAGLRVVMTEGMVAVAPPALEWAQKIAVEQKDPKGFDQVMRAVHAIEQVAVSLSGENRPVKPAGPTIQVAVLPGWSKGAAPGEYGQMATVQTVPQVVEVKPADPPESASMKELKALLAKPEGQG